MPGLVIPKACDRLDEAVFYLESRNSVLVDTISGRWVLFDIVPYTLHPASLESCVPIGHVTPRVAAALIANKWVERTTLAAGLPPSTTARPCYELAVRGVRGSK